MTRPNGPVFAMLVVLCGAMSMTAAACEDDPNDLDYLKAGSGGNGAAAGKPGSSCTSKCEEGCKCGTSGAGSAGKAGASSDVDAG